jgi:monovalent cation:H+ antiporter, CPA1 family
MLVALGFSPLCTPTGFHATMTFLDILAILLVLSALFGFINHNYLKLPHTIGLVAIALTASLAVVAVEAAAPQLGIARVVRSVLEPIDFRKVMLDGFLSALLFAGAVHANLAEMTRRGEAIIMMATMSVLISTAAAGCLMWAAAHAAGYDLPFVWALLFGALISPTDPVAVLGVLKRVNLPAGLKAKMSGESLLNDGVGVVLFMLLLAVVARGADGGAAAGAGVSAADIGMLFLREAGGGAALGFVAGFAAFGVLRGIDEHNIEIMITLALVASVYSLGQRLHVSGPIAIVIAGLIIGNPGARLAMSDNTRERVFQFWDLVDEILNSVLFLLIGLQVLVLSAAFGHAWLAIAAIPIVLLARFISVGVPLGLLSLGSPLTPGSIPILTWGGLRGGISVALALALPDSPYKNAILTSTYAVVVFSILAQGLTMEGFARWMFSPRKKKAGDKGTGDKRTAPSHSQRIVSTGEGDDVAVRLHKRVRRHGKRHK